jgi:hypothetical protein
VDINDFKPANSPPSEPPKPPVNPKFNLENDAYVIKADVKTSNKPTFTPYPAKISLFIILFIGSLYSVASLVSYGISKLLIGQQGLTQYDYSSLVDSDSFRVLFSVSWLIISLPVLGLLVRQFRRSEKNEPWRISQKWRRVFYTVAMVVVSLSIIGILTGTVYNLFQTDLGSGDTPTPVAPVYNDPSISGAGLLQSQTASFGTSTAPANNKTLELTSTALSGLAVTILLIGSLFVLAHEYAGRAGKLIWMALSTLLIVGIVAGTFSVIKLYEPYTPLKATSTGRFPSTYPSTNCTIPSCPSCTTCGAN